MKSLIAAIVLTLALIASSMWIYRFATYIVAYATRRNVVLVGLYESTIPTATVWGMFYLLTH